MVNEFVGPSRFQWTNDQLKSADKLMRITPEFLRYDPESHQIKDEIRRPDIAPMITGDPSPAVRWANIERVLKPYG